MVWWGFLLVFLGLLLFFMFIGMPVVFSFLVVNILAVAYIVSFEAGLNNMILSMYDSLAKFTLTPIPFFVLMGEILFHSGLVLKTLDILSKWFGRIPGRLSILSIAGGTLFATMSGSNIANTSMLGSVLVPDMRKRGYHVSMTVGPILASGSLAMIIPPSAMAVLLGAMGQIPVDDLLIAGIIPGIVMAISFIIYIIYKCWRNPELAPVYDIEEVSFKEKVQSFFKYVFPMSVIIFMVLGFIFFGIATPTESAAIGALGAIIVTAAYRALNKEVIWKSLQGTLKITGMIFIIIASSAVFSQLLAYTGAGRELITLLTGLDIEPIWIVIIMMLIVIIMGCFLDQVSIMMVTLPLFMPMIAVFQLDPVWFGLLMLIALDLGHLTPPLGLLLYVMKGVSPKDITMSDIIKSAVPFIALEVVVLTLIMMLPKIATWLPTILSS
ncbi:C4-dicarboxylate ABC transporter permease [Bacillus sp. M6-12]|uniref:TRAP transporter large permease n=1 Tax=Bacillus sp. M6-12 TaxID=2054166 RepID=UPI000C7717DF|nr:TRAP transporter large permease subunit [Bacillus sp. M6-12]PLS18596.1 C4-dicarboxylate ABC transporter permease [Bacillus sp. M6-12]